MGELSSRQGLGLRYADEHHHAEGANGKQVSWLQRARSQGCVWIYDEVRQFAASISFRLHSPNFHSAQRSRKHKTWSLYEGTPKRYLHRKAIGRRLRGKHLSVQPIQRFALQLYGEGAGCSEVPWQATPYGWHKVWFENIRCSCWHRPDTGIYLRRGSRKVLHSKSTL